MTAFRLTCPSCQGTGVNWHEISGPVGHDEPICCSTCLGRGSVENEAFGQGRPPAKQVENVRWAGYILYVMAAMLALAALLSAFGCAGPGPTRTAMICGQAVTFHPDDLSACNGGASACTVKPVTSAAFHVYYSTLDESVLSHEEEHVCGMRHREPWVMVAGKVCTVVTDGGNTAWRRGDVMCRINAGPPVKLSDDRVRKFLLGGAPQ